MAMRKPSTMVNVNNILRESEEAMKRFSEKLRKETAKYAKQKQSKR
jgi:tRNA(Phe) wybutosine-synthesizing methylase Tyw3